MGSFSLWRCQKKEVMTMSEYMTCEVCHRVIRVEHGPVCCFCVDKAEADPKPARKKLTPKEVVEKLKPVEMVIIDAGAEEPEPEEQTEA